MRREPDYARFDIHQEALPKVPRDQTQGRRHDHLLEPEAQAASRLVEGEGENDHGTYRRC